MNLFEEIVIESSLLTEDVSINSINSAIDGLHPAWITYDDNQGGKGKARRLIYPVAYGETTAGNPVVRAFQPQGSSKRGLTTPPNNREYPKWKYFRVDRIKFWRTVNSNTYNPEELVGFNEDGDKSMSVVYTIAPIGNAKKIQKQNLQTNTDAEKTTTVSFKPQPITKDEVENINIEPTQQPSKNKYTAKNAIDSIINFIKNGGKKISSNAKNLFKKNLENKPENTNIETGSTVNAPDTTPVTKQDISNKVQDIEQEIGDNVQNTEQNVNLPNDEPVTKQEIDGEENTDLKECVLATSFRDMINRMNNLYD